MNFSRHSRAANSLDTGPFLPNFEPIQEFIAVLTTCKNEDDPIKNDPARVLTLYIDFSDTQGQLRVVGDGIWQKFKLTQAL